jgi:choline dehydrogenase-like flavoprotein
MNLLSELTNPSSPQVPRQAIVVGSGPAGISCATALLARGVPVTMLDGGLELEPERTELLAALRAKPSHAWTSADTAFLKHNIAPDRKGVGVKYVYGSDYPYRDVQRFMPMSKSGVDTTASLAIAGFSTVWGSSILPYHDDDITDWPFSISEIADHYRAVLRFMPASAVNEELASLLPLYTDRNAPLKPSAQAGSFLRHLRLSADRLHSRGIHFGASRLAVREKPRSTADDNPATPPCAYCGLCMYGCPYNLIYSTDQTLAQLKTNPLFTHLPGVIVDSISESPAHVQLSARLRDTETPLRLYASRAYIGAGVLSTARILLNSLPSLTQPLTLRDSQYFLFPFLRFPGSPGVQSESLHTLAQLFLEIRDPAVSPKTVHLQVYTYNDLFAAALAKTAGPLAPLAKPLMGPLLQRMLVMQGYLHSDFSSRVEIRRAPDGHLSLTAIPAQDNLTKRMIRRVTRKLARNARHLRGIPLSPMTHIPDAGRGYHTGGTFPMRTTPTSPSETDLLGRPKGLSRTHLIDSSVLPSIPATTITLSVMANAHRIGSLPP